MTEANIEHDAGTWRHHGDEVERLPVQTGSGSTGPSDTTVFYCLPREETTSERVADLRAALEDAGYELRETDSEGGNYKIVIPAEVEEDDEDQEDDGKDESDPEFEEMTKNELYELASEQEIDGRSEMTKAELVDALSA